MKKYLGILALILAGILVLGCKHNTVEPVTDENNGNVVITLGAGERTITPAEWTVGSVESWDFTFVRTDATVDNIFKNSGAESCLTSSRVVSGISVPAGTYKIFAEGTGVYYPLGTDDGDSSPSVEFILCGEVGNVEVTAGGTAEVTIPVSLKKTSDGKGSFNYVIILSNDNFLSNYELPADGATTNYVFSAYLTNCDSREEVPLTISLSKDASALGLTLSGENITSGYYYLTVSYTYDKKTFYIDLNDCLVEITDDLATTNNYTNGDEDCYYYDSTFAGVVTKNIYVNNTESSNNGLIPSYPKEFNSTITWLNENQKEWTIANLYFITSSTDSVTSYTDYVKALVPYYKDDVNPTSGATANLDSEGNELTDTDGNIIYTYSDGYNKEVNVYIDGELNYVLKNGGLYITNDCVSNPSVCFAKVESDGTPMNGASLCFDEDVTGKELTLYQMTGSVIVDGVSETLPSIHSILCPDLATAYVSSSEATDDNPESDQYLIISGGSLEAGSIILNDNISISALRETYSSSWIDDTTYIALTTSKYYTVDDKIYLESMDCFSALASQAGLTISKAVPDFKISGETDVNLEDSETIYSCKTDEYDEEDSVTLDDGYIFEWRLNGNTVSTEATYSLNPTSEQYVLDGENTLLLIVGKALDTDGDGETDKTEYASKSITITVSSTPLLYTTLDYGSSPVYYRSISPSSTDTRLSLSLAVRAAGNAYFGITSSNKIVYFDGTNLDETSYANYELPSDINCVYSGYYDPVSKYLYVCLTTYDDGWAYYLVAVDTSKTPTEATEVPKATLTNSTLYRSLFVKNGVLCGSVGKDEYSAQITSTGYRSIAVSDDSITLGEISTIDLTSTIGVSALADNHHVVIKDFYYYDNYVYFLCKYGIYQFGSSSELTALGYIGRFSITDSGTISIDTSYKVGWLESPAGTTVSFTKDSAATSMTVYTPSESGTGYNGFWGPERIVGIKKDNEIVIEDYGIYKTDNAGYFDVKGGFATVNLGDKSFKYTTSDIKFGSISASSGWSMVE